MWNLELNSSLMVGYFFLICKFTVSCSMFPKSTHETFANKLYQTFKSHKRFVKPKLSRTDFAIAHYAGEVCYLTKFLRIYIKSHTQNGNCCELMLKFLFRSCINLINFWIKTRIMWFQNIKTCWVLPIVLL